MYSLKEMVDFKPKEKFNTEVEKNIPFAHAEIKEHFSQSRTPLLNTEPNRKERRLEMFAKTNTRAVNNNRGNANITDKLAHFAMAIMSKRKYRTA